MIDYAKLSHLGFSIFPIGYRTKRPDMTPGVLPTEWHKPTWKPFMVTKADAAQLDRWFQDGTRNIGLILGAISGFVCIDTDDPAAEAWVHQTLPPTPMMTRGARGFHRFYRYPYGPFGDGVPASLYPPDVTDAHGAPIAIELRRDGQYVVGPGSTHPTGHVYTEVTPWPRDPSTVPELPDLVLRFAAPSVTAAHRPDGHVSSALGLEHLTPADLGFVPPEVIPQTERHRTLFKLTRSLKAKGLSLEDTLTACQAVNDAQCRPPLAASELVYYLSRCFRQADRLGYGPLATYAEPVPRTTVIHDHRGLPTIIERRE